MQPKIPQGFRVGIHRGTLGWSHFVLKTLVFRALEPTCNRMKIFNKLQHFTTPNKEKNEGKTPVQQSMTLVWDSQSVQVVQTSKEQTVTQEKHIKWETKLVYFLWIFNNNNNNHLSSVFPSLILALEQLHTLITNCVNQLAIGV